MIGWCSTEAGATAEADVTGYPISGVVALHSFEVCVENANFPLVDTHDRCFQKDWEEVFDGRKRLRTEAASKAATAWLFVPRSLLSRAS